MKFVLDTNILVASLSTTSESHHLIEALLGGQFELIISHKILLEYEEVLTRKYGSRLTINFLKALHELPNVHQIQIWFNWNFISHDPDDNKFADTAITAGNCPIVSEDRHFKMLRNIEFPKIEVWRLHEFEAWLKSG